MKLELTSEEFEQLERKIASLGDEAENTVNSIVHDFGFETMNKDIIDVLPKSERNKRHAKTSKPFKIEKENLGFTIKTKGGAANKKGSFGYLVFPDEGRGSKNKIAQDFSGKGSEKAKPKIIEELEKSIIKKLQEVI